MRETLAAAARAQTRLAIPMQQGFFMPEDERRAGEDEERCAEEDVISSGAEEEEEGDEGSDPEVSSGAEEEEEGGEAGGSDDDDDDDEAPKAGPSGRKLPGGAGRPGKATAGRGTKRAAAAAPAADEDDDDTGYGAGGLSWEAVLGAIQVWTLHERVNCVNMLPLTMHIPDVQHSHIH